VHVTPVMKALGWIEFHCTLHPGCETNAQVRCDVPDTCVLASDHKLYESGLRTCEEWPRARQQAIHRDAHRIDVRCNSSSTRGPHFGSNGYRRSLGRRLLRCVQSVNEAEVPKKGKVVAIQEDVRWLDVSMKQPAIMTRSKPDQSLADPADYVVRSYPGRRSQQAIIRRTHPRDTRRDIWNVVGDVRVIDPQNVIALKSGENLGLSVGVNGRRSWRKGLEGNLHILVRVCGAPDRVVALAELSDDLVAIRK
jgi:hypothetical protein